MKLEAKHEKLLNGEWFDINETEKDVIDGIISEGYTEDYSCFGFDSQENFEEWLEDERSNFSFRFDFDSVISDELNSLDTEIFLEFDDDDKLEAYFNLCSNYTYCPNEWGNLSSYKDVEEYARNYIEGCYDIPDFLDNFINWEGLGDFFLGDVSIWEGSRLWVYMG